ncbi:hypothetical protein K4L44_06570 [Halosquirtibacter laminarini]|uniref:Uncharacterized protein n=1 Tax=Halosquirtibacter laminarini TaxID=3374600 RepID=A0AC61NIE5_9BACT|nr:hypothetical protein K4L44_06570 [Prolixibacteraceae bacterium]
MGEVKNKYRYIARFYVEAATALHIGSGESNANIDQLIVRDSLGLPMIPGTSLMGVIRHGLSISDDFDVDKICGSGGTKGTGSCLKISSAHIVGDYHKVIERHEDEQKDLYRIFEDLPVRHHARIMHTGATKKHGKFDNEVLYKGTRFCFEVELEGTELSQKEWQALLTFIKSPRFRIGGGTRNGIGKLKVLSFQERAYNLENSIDLLDYISKPNSLNSDFKGAIKHDCTLNKKDITNWSRYELNIIPEEGMLFGSSLAGSVDVISVEEQKISYQNDKVTLSGSKDKKEVYWLIPGSSVKGAISHRVAYHYNKDKGLFSDQVDDISNLVGANNLAVRTLFGFTSEECNNLANDELSAARGRVIFEDMMIPKRSVRVLNHVTIDRFTGGAMDGHLFNEEIAIPQKEMGMTIYLDRPESIDADIILAFEKTLKDITTGMLPLGGGVNRGHGCFEGTVTRNDQPLKF